MSQLTEFLESESDLIDFLIAHPCRDGHQQIQVKRSELAQRLSVELVRIFHDLVGHDFTIPLMEMFFKKVPSVSQKVHFSLPKKSPRFPKKSTLKLRIAYCQLLSRESKRY